MITGCVRHDAATSMQPAARRLRWRAVGAILLLPALAGCAGSGDAVGALRAESLGSNPVVLKADYVAAVYSHGQAPETSFILSDVPLDSLLKDGRATAQIVHIDLLWEPKPGATPLDSAATNASIRYVVMVGKEVGIYGGAGFVMPSGSPGKSRLTLSVRDASLTLLESTDGFVDVLGLAQLTGRFTAVRDDALARQIRYAVSQRVTDALGRSRMVERSSSPGEVIASLPDDSQNGGAVTAAVVR